MTDHRISLSVSGVDRVLAGESLSTITDALGVFDEKEKLARFLEEMNNSSNN